MQDFLYFITFLLYIFNIGIISASEDNGNYTSKTIDITNKIEDSISIKGDIFRQKYLKELDLLIEKYKTNKEKVELIKKVKENVKDSSRILIQKQILEELEKEGIPNLNFLYSSGTLDNYPFLLNKLLEKKKISFYKLLQTPEEKITFSIIEEYNYDDKLYYLYNLLEHYNNTNGNGQTRQILENFQDKFNSFNNEIALSKKMYNFYKIINNNKNLDSDQKRIIERTITSFELSGINLSDEKLKLVKEIQQELSKLSFEFGKNLIDSQKEFSYYVEDIDKIKDLPQDILEIANEDAIKQNKKGYLFNYNTASELIGYSSDENIRKNVREYYKTFASSGKYDNRVIILKILNLRDKLAKITGYNNYGEYSLADKMAPSPDFVMKQEDEILKKANIKTEKEIKEIKEHFNLSSLNIWDYGYYSRLLSKEKYNYDENVLRDYFEYNRTIKGLFDIANKLYGLTFEEISTKSYNDDIKTYKVYKDGVFKGFYLLDSFYNPNKSSGAWASILKNKQNKGNQTVYPIVYNVSNIAKGKDETLIEGLE